MKAITPCKTTAAASAMRSAVRANCSISKIDNLPEAKVADALVVFGHYDRGQTKRQLVEEKHRGVCGEGAGESEPLLFPARQAASQLLPFGAEPGKLGHGHLLDRLIGTPTCVAMKRFSRTVRFGNMLRPSGMVQMPFGPGRRQRASSQLRR